MQQACTFDTAHTAHVPVAVITAGMVTKGDGAAYVPVAVCRVERAKRGTPLVRCSTLSILTTFPIFYASCMRNQRTIIGNVVEGSVTWGWS